MPPFLKLKDGLRQEAKRTKESSGLILMYYAAWHVFLILCSCCGFFVTNIKIDRGTLGLFGILTVRYGKF